MAAMWTVAFIAMLIPGVQLSVPMDKKVHKRDGVLAAR